MLLSYDRKFLFIHVPKAAGMSVHHALARVSADAIEGRGRQRHIFAVELKRELGSRVWARLFTFAFVRNPWSRLVSWYNMCVEHPTTPFMWRVNREVRNFAAFLQLPDEFLARTRFNQVDYITDKAGNLLLDFIGKYETLDRDFDHICSQIGVVTELPHLNTTTRVDYRDYYTPQLRKLVADRFDRDIEMFGYRFEIA